MCIRDSPRAAIQFIQGEGHGRPFGGDLDLGTSSYVGARYVVLLAIAAENDWRLSRCTGTSASTTTCARTSGSATTGNRARTGSCGGTTRTGSSASGGACAATAETSATETSAAAKIQAPNIALA